jgi:hypothetical protein
LYVFASFLAGIACAVVVPLLLGRAADRLFDVKEIARVTSPDGAVDAVMIRDNCGAPCSYGYSVFVVPKGQAAPSDLKRNVFSADEMVGERLAWKQAHLLSVVYEKALIYSFRNVSYPLGEFHARQKNWNYKVEIQLGPPAAFAYLQQKGTQ